MLLARGFGGYRTATRIADTSTSRIASLAAGEVRVSGVIEPAEVTLVSLLQSRPCVYYRATIGNPDGRGMDRGIAEERSVGFRVRDASGDLRVFPRGARVDAPMRFEGSSGPLGDTPVGLDLRTGAAFQAAEVDHAGAVAALLQVREPRAGPDLLAGRGASWTADRRYREARLEPGDTVTIVGRALPFGDLDDPDGADLGTGPVDVGIDPEIAADVAAARATGTLTDDPVEAWGNAAIPGFGIGRPVRRPVLDPAASALPIGTAAEAARAERTFAIAPETLVLAASDDVPLLVAYGAPGTAAGREQGRFLIGLLGAVVSIASAMVLALAVTGTLGR